MTESEIQAILRGHIARNVELRLSLLSSGAVLDAIYAVDHHFWAGGPEEAALLAKALYDDGYLVTCLSPVPTEDDDRLWNVEAQLQQAPAVALTPEFAEGLVRLAARFNGVYDGWGMLVEPRQDDARQ